MAQSNKTQKIGGVGQVTEVAKLEWFSGRGYLKHEKKRSRKRRKSRYEKYQG
jgi:hypothetical protein